MRDYDDLHKAADGLLKFFTTDASFPNKGIYSSFYEIFIADKKNLVLPHLSTEKFKEDFKLSKSEKETLFKNALELLKNDQFIIFENDSHHARYKVEVSAYMFDKNRGYKALIEKENQLEQERIEEKERQKKVDESVIKSNKISKRSMDISSWIGILTLVALGYQIWTQDRPTDVKIKEVPQVFTKPDTVIFHDTVVVRDTVFLEKTSRTNKNSTQKTTKRPLLVPKKI